MRTHRLFWVLFGAIAAVSACDCGKIKSVENLEETPKAASANVAGGVRASSPNFQIVTTTSPGGGNPTSPSFKLGSGIVPATQSTGEAK